MGSIALSVLDRSSIRGEQDRAAAIRDTVRFARQAESLGYQRFWVSEHHSVPGVAGSAPTVLATAIADATERIRVGTGGVMLPNHRPLVVAEQFGVLEALHPGRIDLGIGRSLGFTGGVRAALGAEATTDFEQRVTELLGYFDAASGPYPGVHAFPAEGAHPPVFLLATGSGAQLAARLGLALVIAPVRGTEQLLERIAEYRTAFVPSARLSAPYVLLSTSVAVAETTAAARRLLLPEAWSTAYSRTHGVFGPLEPADTVLARSWSERQRASIEETLGQQIYGTPLEVGERLRELLARTGAEELLITMSTFDRAEMLDSYTRLAELDLP
ncbi:LLM class flavin-dependent oxidoreductase [Sciscionella sediminilitoris]|uniref:LLM class flavin-dependent oxidoreductase n=1 Tax=Sciscionella sediminilitoris TaxID=1445613 RepID=UPI0004DF7798|nr:LLM class flavin-dependent oxidoreductase [Sciscionella sp. SE31]